MHRILAPALLLSLLLGCAAAPTDRVTVRQETASLPWWRAVLAHSYDFRPLPFYTVDGTRRCVGQRELQTVVLENEFLRVLVLPEVGGAVYRVIHKPSGDDLFFNEGKVKEWTPYWESGVKINFPALHHTVHTADQPAAWRIVRNDDGSVTLAMWMEFSRFDEWFNSDYYARYTTLLLSQFVTLRPQRGDFEVTYRITNPAPYRQSRKFWNDAFFPRTHTRNEGVVQGATAPPVPTRTEWIFPARYVSHHHANHFEEWREEMNPLSAGAKEHNTYFAWDIAHGFAGLWYPDVRVNRLRLFDPNAAPGAKQYYRGDGTFDPNDPDRHMYNFVELFGSPDNIMEGVEHWLEAGETFQTTYRYTMVEGIGKASYANEHAVVSVQLGNDATVDAVTLSPTERLQALADEQPLRTVGGASHAPSAPDTPARFALPPGVEPFRLRLFANGREILDQRFPLVIPDDTSAHDRIRTANDDKNPESVERFGDQAGYTKLVRWRKNGYPEGTTPLGRILYRAGRLGEAQSTLRAALKSDPNDGEAHGLLGAILFEQRKHEEARKALELAVSVDRPYPPARWFLALYHLRMGDRPSAREQLATLLTERPNHWEGRLLKAWVDLQDDATREQALTDLAALDREDPADPRVQLLRTEAAAKGDGRDLASFVPPATSATSADTAASASSLATLRTFDATSAARALRALTAEPGAWRRLQEFTAATQGIYLPPKRLQERTDPHQAKK